MQSRRPAVSQLALALLAALALLSPRSVRGVGEYLVQDLGQTIAFPLTDIEQPPFHVVADGVAYFYRDDGIHGRELWRSDGTVLGTFLVVDVCPGVCGAEGFGDLMSLGALGSIVFFAADDGVHGRELWLTDGTAAGTRLVADILPGPRSSEPDRFHAAYGQLYFAADDRVHGRELWRSDGTSSGTRMFLDLDPGPGHGELQSIFSGNGLLFYTRSGGTLWRTDGTPQGTFLLHGSTMNWFAAFKGIPYRFLPDGALLFQGCESSASNLDCELWRTDGTVAGTTLVADLAPGTISSNPNGFFEIGPEIWFTADPHTGSGTTLFRTDGTPSGTQLIPLPPGTRGLSVASFAAALGNGLVFTACDDATGCEPWFTDGTTSAPLGDLWPGAESSIRSQYDRPIFAEVGAAVLLLAEDDSAGLRLWRTNGTPAGTVPVSQLGSPPPDAFFGWFQAYVPATVVDNRLLLFLFRFDRGLEIWSSDGTPLGTFPAATIADQSSAFAHPIDAMYTPGRRRCFAPLRQGVAFTAHSDLGGSLGALYFADGVPDGVAELAPIVGIDTSFSNQCEANEGEVLASGGEGAGRGIWRSDGTAPGTSLLLPLDDSTWFASAPLFEKFQDELYFARGGILYAVPRGASDPSQIRELQTTLGWGTLRAAGEQLYVGGSPTLEVTNGKSDPVPLIPIPPQPDYVEVGDLVAAGSVVFFSADTPAEGPELWRSDGSEAGTGPVRNLRAGPEGAFLRRSINELFNWPLENRIAALGSDFVVFASDDGVAGNELWASDGTEAGTQLVADLVLGPDGSWPRHLVSAGSIAFFAAEDPLSGLELFRTDGTPQGTSLVRDLVVGPDSSVPEELTVQDGVLYFSAWTPEHGREAWRSDGTFAGTYRLTDVAPGPLSSSPARFVRRGDRLFFTATDHLHGFELWARADDGSIPLFIDGFETGDTSRWSAALP